MSVQNEGALNGSTNVAARPASELYAALFANIPPDQVTQVSVLAGWQNDHITSDASTSAKRPLVLLKLRNFMLPTQIFLSDSAPDNEFSIKESS